MYLFIPSSLASHKVVIVGVITSPKLRRDQYKDKNFLKKPLHDRIFGLHRFWPNLAWSSCRGRASIIPSFWWLEGLQTITQTMAPLWLLKHTKEKWNYSLCIYYSPHCVKHLILLSKDPVGWSIFNNFCTNLASLSFSPVYGLARQSLVCTHSNANLFFHFIFIILLKLWNLITVLESFLQKNVLFFLFVL